MSRAQLLAGYQNMHGRSFPTPISRQGSHVLQPAVLGVNKLPGRTSFDKGSTGYALIPNDPQETAVLDLVQDRPRRERMGQCGYSKTMARFTWEAKLPRASIFPRRDARSAN